MKYNPTTARLTLIWAFVMLLLGCQQAPEPEVYEATTEIQTLIPAPDRPAGPVIVCKYEVWASEVAQREVKFGNFPPEYIEDRYRQDKPQTILYPGKKMPTEETLLKILKPQDETAKVVAIVSVERLKETCKTYRFDLPERPPTDQ